MSDSKNEIDLSQMSDEEIEKMIDEYWRSKYPEVYKFIDEVIAKTTHIRSIKPRKY